MIKLSICICSIPSRHETLTRLLKCLTEQRRLDEAQVLVSIDTGALKMGPKRNALVQQAVGEYVVHIDDDDLVHPDYLGKILDAIDADPDVDAIVLRGRRIDAHGKYDPLLFDYRIMSGDVAETENGVLWRSPGHVCPVRIDLALRAQFPDHEPEDLTYVSKLAPMIKRVARAGDPEDVLYHYLWDSKEVKRWY